MRGKARHTDYAGNPNPPILHRKEAFLPADHPKRRLFAALTEAEEAAGLYATTATIGFKLNWERLVASKGLRYAGHRLVSGNDFTGSKGERLLTPALSPDGAEREAPVVVERHKTALVRYELSKPVRTLLEYVGCATTLFGDVQQADMVKLHKSSGKVTFLVYDDFEGRPLPELRARLKVNLRTRWVQVFDHSAEGQLRYLRSGSSRRSNCARLRCVRPRTEWFEVGGASGLRPITCFRRNNPAHTPTCVRNIASVARDDVKMELRNRLTGGGTVVQPEVEGVWFWAQARGQVLLRPTDPEQQALLFRRRQVLEERESAMRDDECVTGRNRIFVPNHSEKVVSRDNALRLDQAEGRQD